MAKHTLATEFERSENSPGLLLWQLSNKWQAKQRAALKPFGITHVQFVLLATVTYAVGKTPLTQKQLAACAQTDVMMTSQVLRKLEQNNFIERAHSTLDKRAIFITPTETGIELVNRAVKAVEAVDARFFSVLGSDSKQFLRSMQIIVEAENQLF